MRYASISELGSAEKIERGFLGTMLRLTSLAPDLVEAIMDDRLSVDIDLGALLATPEGWKEQAAEECRLA